MATASCANCCDGRKPNRYVVSLAGTCCKCGTIATGSQPCGSCSENATQNDFDCSLLNGYFELTVDPLDPCHYVHQFPVGAPGNALSLDLRISDNAQLSRKTVNVCVSLSFGADQYGNPVRTVSWGRTAVKCCCKIGNLRRRTTNRKCCWPQEITVSPVPVRDYVSPRPRWVAEHPDDLNDSPFLPVVDVDLMEVSDLAPVRYSNGELDLRIKDIDSPAFGIPWGHTRIYSNRLSNSFDFGNGTNWLVHEWPQLVSFKTDRGEGRTGCAVALLRGTRNSLWFDEYTTGNSTEWRPRFGDLHALSHDGTNGLFTLYSPNGYVWEFFDFTSPCSRSFAAKSASERAAIAPGRLKRLIGPYGEANQQLTTTYLKCRLVSVERKGSTYETGKAVSASEKFTYEYLDPPDPNAGRLQAVTLSRTVAGATENVSRTEFTYYENDGKNINGNPGDLKTSQLLFWQQADWASRKNTLHYYAYYTAANSTYCQGMLKAIVGPESYNMMITAANPSDPVQSGPIPKYSDLWIEYYDDSDVSASADARTATLLPRRIKTITMDRGGRTHKFAYKFSTMSIDDIRATPHDQWLCETIETRSDNNTVTVYSNAFGQTIARTLMDKSISDTWTNYLGWDAASGFLNESLTPAAVGSLQPTPDGTCVPTRRVQGLITTFTQYKSHSLLAKVVISGQSNATSEKEQKTLHEFKYNVFAQYGPVLIWVLQSDTNPACNLTFSYAADPYNRGNPGVYSRDVTLPATPADMLGPPSDSTISTRFDDYGQPERVDDDRGITTTINNYTMLGVPGRIVRTPAQVAIGSASPETTTITADQFSRITMVQGPAHHAVVGNILLPVQRTQWNIYDDVAGGIIRVAGYQQAGNSRLMNPVAINKFDRSGRLTNDIMAVASSNVAAIPEELALEDFPDSTWCRYRQTLYNAQNQCTERRVYFDIDEEDYYSIAYTEYDALFRPSVVVAPDGTGTKIIYDARSLPLSKFVGISSWQLVSSYEYDRGNDGGNGNCTTITEIVGGGAPQRIVNQTFNWRDLRTDWTVADGFNTSNVYHYDDAGWIKSAGVNVTDPNPLESRVDPVRDNRGRVFANYYIQRSLVGGVLADPKLTMGDLIGHDALGNLAMHMPAGGTGFSKFEYDGFSREVTRNSGFSSGPPPFTPGTSRTYNSVVVPSADDVILEQTRTTYDEIGQPRQVTVWIQAQRDNNVSNLVRGNLAGAIDARANYSETFYDPLGRIVATVNYGSNQPPANPAGIPSASDAILVRRTSYDESGNIAQTIDPAGNVTTFEYDDAGRVTRRTDAGVRTIKTEYYGDDRINTISLIDQNGVSRTMATFLYGPANAGGLSWAINSNSLLAQEVDAAGAATFYGYNVQGEVTSMRDARGFVHQYDRDQNGRVTADRIAQFPQDQSHIDTYVLLITTEYDGKGRPTEINTYSDPTGKTGMLTNVARDYTFFDQVALESQQVWDSTGELAFSNDVVYRYANDTSLLTPISQVSGSASNSIRPESIQYPTGKYVELHYDGAANGALSRVSSIWAAESHAPSVETVTDQLAAYKYAGMNEFYGVSLNPITGTVYPFVDLDGLNKKPFGCVDSFGRIDAWEWWKSGSPSAKPLLQVGYQYNRNSQRTTRQFPQLGNTFKETYAYDGLSRLTDFTRKGAPAMTQDWKLDAAGNWTQFDVSATQSFEQTRKYGPGDRIASIDSDPNWVQPSYDSNGNTIAIPSGADPEITVRNLRYDAWNRLTSMSAATFSTEMVYDGLGRLVWKRQTTPSADPPIEVRHFAWSYDWRLLEEHVLTGTTPTKLTETYRLEYVWGNRGLDDLVCRDVYTSPLWTAPLAQRRYALADLNGNLLATFYPQTSGIDSIVQYDPYGNPAINASSLGGWSQLFCGYYYDYTSGLYLVRNRIYHPQLGRWLQMDPAGLKAGLNGYEYCACDPANLSDPTGEDPVTLALLLIGGAIAIYSAWRTNQGARELQHGVERHDPEMARRGLEQFQSGLLGTAAGLGVMAGPAFGVLGEFAAEALGWSGVAGSTLSGAVTFGAEGLSTGAFYGGATSYASGEGAIGVFGSAAETAINWGWKGAVAGAALGAAGYSAKRFWKWYRWSNTELSSAPANAARPNVPVTYVRGLGRVAQFSGARGIEVRSGLDPLVELAAIRHEYAHLMLYKYGGPMSVITYRASNYAALAEEFAAHWYGTKSFSKALQFIIEESYFKPVHFAIETDLYAGAILYFANRK